MIKKQILLFDKSLFVISNKREISQFLFEIHHIKFGMNTILRIYYCILSFPF